jgi:oligopeptide/dipeptide ABC transporter ATP-binding protein
MSASAAPLLRVEGLKVHFPVRDGRIWPRSRAIVRAVDGVSLSLGRGETLGLVGESGCGKSTTGLAILRMLPATQGRLEFEGEDITARDSGAAAFRKRMQMVYQDPYGSLDPRQKVSDIVAEPLDVHGIVRTRAERGERVAELLCSVGLLPDMAERYPHEFSGGQRQRIGIARALALQPSLVICDEPVSALDVSIQAQVVNLLSDLQERLRLSYLFIAHDLAVVRHISMRVIVMYFGRIMEVADRDVLYRDPQHPYTKVLLDAAPVPDPTIEKGREPRLIKGELPSHLAPPPGCVFNTRCPLASEECRRTVPPLREIRPDHFAACIKI